MKPAAPDGELDTTWDHLEHGPNPMSRVAPDGTVLWANAAAVALVGATRDEHIGRNVADLHADPAATAALLDAIRSGRGTRDQPVRLLTRSGEVRHVLLDVNVRMEGGKPLYGRCCMRDITDRARLDQALQAGLRDALASPAPLSRTTDGYLHLDRGWRITFAHLNVGPERSAAVVGKTLWDLYPDVRGSEFEGHYRAAMADRQPRTFQAYYAPQGIWLENRLFPAGDGLALFYRDVGWQRALEQQLADRNRQQAAVARLGHLALRGEPVGRLLQEAASTVADVLHADMAGIVETVPEGLRVAAVVGYEGGKVGDLVPPDTIAQTAYARGQARAVVVEDLQAESRFRPSAALLALGAVSGISVPIEGPDGLQGVLSLHTRTRRSFTQDDVHFAQNVANLLGNALQRARADEALRAQRDQLEDTVAERTALLERSNREMEAFNYTVSHDLRSPLRNIGGFAGLLAHRYGPQLPPEARQILDRILQGVGRMGDLIDVLLDLARLHRVELQRTEVDVTAMAQAIAGELAANGGRDVDLHVEPGLRALADPGLTRVLLENLLTNAWKFTRRSAVPRVEVVHAQVVDGPGFVVRDNGAGFDPEHAGRLFEPFHRLHNVAEYEGTGIGLATVRRIAERHGGRVWAQGRLGEGAAFGFTLPAPPQPRRRAQ